MFFTSFLVHIRYVEVFPRPLKMAGFRWTPERIDDEYTIENILGRETGLISLKTVPETNSDLCTAMNVVQRICIRVASFCSTLLRILIITQHCIYFNRFTSFVLLHTDSLYQLTKQRPI